MMNVDLALDRSVLSSLNTRPTEKIRTDVCGKACRVSICIPEYLAQIKKYYPTSILSDIHLVQLKSGIKYNTKHFGVLIHFNEAAELQLHDADMEIGAKLKELIAEFGVVIIKNAYLNNDTRDLGHRNRFPHLKFHYDRNEAQHTVYSLYTRNPFDEEQKKPRIGSTLFIPNIVAYLQSLKEGNHVKTAGNGLCSNYDLFTGENIDQMKNILSNIVLEHRWDEPEGVGEISMIDNRTVLHASYYRDGSHPGYKIGVRYCS